MTSSIQVVLSWLQHLWNIEVTEATIITLSNSLVILLYVRFNKTSGRKSRKGKISNYLLLNQALTDLYIGFTVWYDIAFSQHSDNNAVFLMKYAMLEYSLTLSLTTLLLGALERYLAITRPFVHKSYVTFERLVCATSTVWCFSLLTPLTLLSLMNFNAVLYLNHPHVVMYSYVFDCLMFLCICFSCAILLLTFKAANSSCTLRRKIGGTQGNARLREQSMLINKQKKIRLVVIFICMMIGYILTFLPLMIGRLLYDAGVIRSLSMDEEILLVTLIYFYKSSAILNPFLTMCRKDDYRRTLVGLVWRKNDKNLRIAL